MYVRRLHRNNFALFLAMSTFVRNYDLKSNYGDMDVFSSKKDAGAYLQQLCSVNLSLTQQPLLNKREQPNSHFKLRKHTQTKK